VLALADAVGARAADVGPDSIVFELVGSPAEVDSFEELLRPHGLQELGRTGRLALARAEKTAHSRPQHVLA
jgi:acetolactate synthase-1/3 small subunit